MSANLVAPTAAWESRVAVPSLPVEGFETEDANGFWGIDTTGPGDGFSVTVSGFEGIDAAAASGNRQRVLNGTEVIY